MGFLAALPGCPDSKCDLQVLTFHGYYKCNQVSLSNRPVWNPGTMEFPLSEELLVWAWTSQEFRLGPCPTRSQG